MSLIYSVGNTKTDAELVLPKHGILSRPEDPKLADKHLKSIQPNPTDLKLHSVNCELKFPSPNAVELSPGWAQPVDSATLANA